MRTDFTINIENNHISFAVDGETQVYRTLTPVEGDLIKSAAEYDRMEFSECENGCFVLVALYTLEILKMIKYGMDSSLMDCIGKI